MTQSIHQQTTQDFSETDHVPLETWLFLGYVYPLTAWPFQSQSSAARGYSESVRQPTGTRGCRAPHVYAQSWGEIKERTTSRLCATEPLNRRSFIWMARLHFTVITADIPMLYNPATALAGNVNALILTSALIPHMT